ncbi:hypothetical protein [Streptomyces sp. HYC2]|uniref:hypothetical protein n=1 Tax=Streptomyces sp. HYC2 TaxID=2955207 RepID=UPI0024816CF9|nr:hypothetical protein [Streptomyces sp. HYC2]
MIEALVALGEVDSLLKGVEVADGPQVTDTAAPDWLVVGFDGDPSGDFEAAQSVGGWSDLRSGREEEFQITVAAIANRGDADIVAARRRAYEIAARVEAWLRADPSIGLRSLEAAIGATRLVQDQTEEGAHARLLLTVVGRAFT